MIFQTDMSIAVKTIEGNYSIKNFSAFNLNKINEESTCLSMSFLNNKILTLKVNCMLCENIHYYKYNISELIRKDITIGGCDVLGFPILYIGNCKAIENEILKYNKANTRIYALI